MALFRSEDHECRECDVRIKHHVLGCTSYQLCRMLAKGIEKTREIRCPDTGIRPDCPLPAMVKTFVTGGQGQQYKMESK